MGINKIHWYLGYNSLAILTEQERKHWLMKTDKQKQVVDPVTGDQYQGQIDNMGSDVIIETEKLATKHSTLMNLELNDNLRYIFGLEPSAFTYCSEVNNFNFCRVKSINYPINPLLEDLDESTIVHSNVSYKNYRIKFEDTETVILPFGGSNSTSEVFATKWIKSNNVHLELLNDSGVYVDSIPITFVGYEEDIYFYYPLTPSLQTIPLQHDGIDTYSTLPIKDEQMIGYPVLWFNLPITIDEGNMGCWATCEGWSSLGRQLVAIGNPGDATIYTGRAYVCIDGNNNATPHDSPTSEVYITCYAVDGYEFNNSDADYYIPIQRTFDMDDRSYSIDYNGETTKITMSPNEAWEYVDNLTYRIKMSTFDSNCMANGSNPLEPVFNIDFDKNLNADYTNTIDTGVTGIRMNSGNPYSDLYKNYPYDLNKWDGLPDHLKNIDENHVPEHMAIYAIHNTPTYIPEVPDSRQVAALLLDLGIRPNDEFDFYLHFKSTTGEVPATDRVGERYLKDTRNYRYTEYMANCERDPHFKELYKTYSDWVYDKAGYDGHDYLDYIINPSEYELGEGTYEDEQGVEHEYDDEHPIATYEDWADVVKEQIRIANRIWENTGQPYYMPRDIIFGIDITHSFDPNAFEDDLINCYGYCKLKGETEPDMAGDDKFIIKLYKGAMEFDSIGNIIGFDMSAVITFLTNGDINLDEVDTLYITRVVCAAHDGADPPPEYQVPLRFSMTVMTNTDTYGRVYVLSNDAAEYENNATANYPKPDRTVARICDIPTSLVQLTGITGVAPTNVVDPDYVRTEVSFTVEDKDHLYNKLASRWVRPCHSRIAGAEVLSDNDYIFTSINDLNTVDLYYQNDFRYLTNLNPLVYPEDVKAGSIFSYGTGYKRGDIGIIYIGGFAFEYEVETVNTMTGVSSFVVRPTITADSAYTDGPHCISLYNFNMMENGSGYTEAYGTAPKTGNGKGFRCSLHIDHYEDYLPKKGDIFEDLFALVKLTDGLWIYEYSTKSDKWTKTTQVAQFDNKNPESIYQTTTDAYMGTVVPRRHTLPVNRSEDNVADVENLDVLSTSNFVNIIDTTRTPLMVDTTISDKNPQIKIDLCKLRCDGFTKYQAEEKTYDAMLTKIKEKLNDKIPADTYMALRWDDDNDVNNLNFYVGFINRSFNNLLVEDDISVMPEDKLKYPYHYNSNPNTTIVWDVKGVGPMMWVFNPNSQVREKYIIDEERQSFYIDRELLSWENVDIYSPNRSETPSLFDEDGKIMYDIYTNSITHPEAKNHMDYSERIYDQPEFFKIVNKGENKDNITNIPTGNWTCVFPRVSGFVFENDSTKEQVIPIQMQMTHGTNVVRTAKLYNTATGVDESSRTVIFEDTADAGVRLRVFNSETSTWDTV